MTGKIVRFVAVFLVAGAAVFFALDAHFAKLDRDSYKEKFYGQERRAEMLRADVKRSEGETQAVKKGERAEEGGPLAKQDRRLEKVRGFWNEMFAENGLKWDAGEFPHPTFVAGGTKEGYGQFAWALLFLLDTYRHEVQDVLDAPLVYRSGDGRLVNCWTFRLLLSSFSNPDGFGDHSEYCRGKLLEHSVRMNDKK